MEYQLTLPALQRRLDHLAAAQTLTLARKQVESLFGLNDVAITRVSRFARGHNCIVAHADDCVVFRKLPPSPARAVLKAGIKAW